MPFKSSLVRSAGKLFGVFRERDLSLRGYVQSKRLSKVWTSATGGTTSDYSDPGPGILYRAHIFTASGALSVTQVGGGGGGPSTVEYLVVGGGGGGGASENAAHDAGTGGGGAGGFVTGSFTLSLTPYPITVGGGGGTATAGSGNNGNPGSE